MAVERVTVSFPPELAQRVREAAEADSQSVSAWLARAAERGLANHGLAAVVSEWEAEHGAFTDAELAKARGRLPG